MAGTRSGAKGSSQTSSSPPKAANTASKKRGAPTESSPEPKKKRGRPSKASKANAAAVKSDEAKEQKTLEETFTEAPTNGEATKDETLNGEDKGDKDEVMKDAETNGAEKDEKKESNGNAEAEVHGKDDGEKPVEKTNGAASDDSKTGKAEDLNKIEEQKPTGKTNGTSSSGTKSGEGPAKEKNAFDEVKSDEADAHKSAEKEQDTKTEEIKANDDSIIEDPAREAAMPSSILEKGIIYFFFRARVNIDEPQGIEDVARSYIVLRPIPIGAKIGDGPLQDDGKARLLALPKKMLPKSKNDRFLVFVDKAGASVKDLREQFSGAEYATKTVGTSQQPSAAPFAEGVYAITSTGRESHLAYNITVPKEIGEIQTELGINSKGSFVCSVKNPEAPGPANASLDNPAKYPKELQDKFRGLRWTPLVPKFLDYESTQMLIIGEGVDGGFGKAVDELKKDAKNDEKEKPEEELQKLEEEDHDRVEGLKEDDPVFVDLGLSSKEYTHMETTW